ncbi:hypothetical protein E4U42_003438, partial [Claviceps africana]
MDEDWVSVVDGGTTGVKQPCLVLMRQQQQQQQQQQQAARRLGAEGYFHSPAWYNHCASTVHLLYTH